MRLLDALRRTIPVHACSSSEFDDLPLIGLPPQLPVHDGDMAELEHLLELLGATEPAHPGVWSDIGDALAIELGIDDVWPIDNPVYPLLDAWRDQIEASEAML